MSDQHPPDPPVWTPAARWALASLCAFALGMASWHAVGRIPESSGAPHLRRGAVPLSPMDLNSADEDRLASIPGIGPTLASRIVAHRASQGPFSSVEELRQVRGVGPATLERIRPFLLTEDGGTPRQPPRVVRGARQDEPVEKPNKVRLNSAPIEELRTLPGIGPVLAERILEARASARFRSLEDLRRVKGLGPKTLERLRPFATVD